MSYTPVELRHVRVGRSLFGYNRAMVEQVIEEVAESFEATWRERGELADRVEELEKQLAELRKREDLLTQTLVAAEQAASDVRERARREAEAIIIEAHSESRAIGRSAQAERERLVTESRRIEMMLRGALGMIEERAAAVAVVAPPPQTVAGEALPAPAAPEPAVTPAQDEAPSLPPVGDAPPESWSREDTREFEPVAPTHVEEPPEDGGGDDSRTPAAAVHDHLPGWKSRDFDWGE
jgi:hypothetical protein